MDRRKKLTEAPVQEKEAPSGGRSSDWKQHRATAGRKHAIPVHPNTKKPQGQRAYEPTEGNRRRVRMLAMLGLAKEMIARDLAISSETLRKYYARELDEGDIAAYAQVAGRLFKKAMEGDTIAMIFWMKARNGWIDRREVSHQHTINPPLSHEERLKALEAGPPPPPGYEDDHEDPDEGVAADHDPDGGPRGPVTIDGEATDTTEDFTPDEDPGPRQELDEVIIEPDPYAKAKDV